MGLCSSNSYDESLQALPQVKPTNNKLRVVLQPLSSNKLYKQRVAPSTFYGENQIMAKTFQLSELSSRLESQAGAGYPLTEIGMELSRRAAKDYENRKTYATVSTNSVSDKEEQIDSSLSAKTQESIFQ